MRHTLRMEFLTVLPGLVAFHFKSLRLLNKILNQDCFLSDSQATIKAILIVGKRLHVLDAEQVHLQLLSYIWGPILH